MAVKSLNAEYWFKFIAGLRTACRVFAATLFLAVSSFASAYAGYYIQGDLDSSSNVVDFDDSVKYDLPFMHHTLPAALLHVSQPDLQLPPSIISVGDLPNNFTVSAWVHVPHGKAVTVISNEMLGTDADFQIGVGSTSVFGDSAAAVLGTTPESLPEHFLFFAQSTSPSSFGLATLCPLELPAITQNGAEWHHIAFAHVNGFWAAISDGESQTFGIPGALNQLFNRAHHNVTAFPLIPGDQFGGHIGDFAVYPDLLMPNLATQLGAAGRFGVPEPVSLAALWLGTVAMACLLPRRCRRRVAVRN